MTEPTKQELADRIEQLEQRVADLENSGGGAAPGRFDRYDRSVLDELVEGKTYTVDELKRLYRRAGIRQDSTLKSRVRTLTQDVFDRNGPTHWTFEGVAEGEK